MLVHLGELPLKEVLPFIGGQKTIQVDEKTYVLSLTSARYYVFKSSLVCSACGRVGVVFGIDQNIADSKPHLNLYAIEDNGTRVLMTRDHIVPRSLGGSNALDNQRTMCFPCNHFRGNKASLTLEQIRTRWVNPVDSEQSEATNDQ